MLGWREKLDVARLITRSWVFEPERWKWDEYRATRDDGLSVWIANRRYGLEVQYAGYEFGGVWEPWSKFQPWRREIWLEMKHIKARKQYDAFAKLFRARKP